MKFIYLYVQFYRRINTFQIITKNWKQTAQIRRGKSQKLWNYSQQERKLCARVQSESTLNRLIINYFFISAIHRYICTKMDNIIYIHIRNTLWYDAVMSDFCSFIALRNLTETYMMLSAVYIEFMYVIIFRVEICSLFLCEC